MLLKFPGFTAKKLADAGDTARFDLGRPEQYEKYKAHLDDRDYQLNAVTIRLTNAIREIWNLTQDSRDANKLCIKVDGQYLKVVVEDDLGVEVELDRRSEGFRWMMSFYVVFFAEASDKQKMRSSCWMPDYKLNGLHAALNEIVARHREWSKRVLPTNSLVETMKTVYPTLKVDVPNVTQSILSKIDASAFASKAVCLMIPDIGAATWYRVR